MKKSHDQKVKDCSVRKERISQWLDMSDYVDPKRMKETILDKCHLAVDFGELFGGENYKSHIRLNLATSRENIEEVVKRLQLITN